MSKKRTLRNVEAVHQMLAGEHKTQTKTTIGFTGKEGQTQITHKPGDIWEETDSTGKHICWWELSESGTKIKYNVHPDVAKAMHEVRRYLNTFPNCPKEVCTCTVPSNLDKKFKRATGMCEDCTVTMETRLKIRGEFNEYAQRRMFENATKFFQDADVEIEKFKESLKKTEFLSGENGEIEKWDFDNVEEVIKNMDDRYADYRSNVLEKLQGQ